MIPIVNEDETRQDLLIIFRFVSKLLLFFYNVKTDTLFYIPLQGFPNLFLVKDHFYKPVVLITTVDHYYYYFCMWSHILAFLFTHKNNYFWIIEISYSSQFSSLI